MEEYLHVREAAARIRHKTAGRFFTGLDMTRVNNAKHNKARQSSSLYQVPRNTVLQRLFIRLPTP